LGIAQIFYVGVHRSYFLIQQFVNTKSKNVHLLMYQIGALFYRHYLWTIRNPMRTFAPLVIAILLLIALGLFFRRPSSSSSSSSPFYNLAQNRQLSLDNSQESMRIPIQIPAGGNHQGS
jgi:hypothetical protein